MQLVRTIPVLTTFLVEYSIGKLAASVGPVHDGLRNLFLIKTGQFNSSSALHTFQ